MSRRENRDVAREILGHFDIEASQTNIMWLKSRLDSLELNASIEGHQEVYREIARNLIDGLVWPKSDALRDALKAAIAKP